MSDEYKNIKDIVEKTHSEKYNITTTPTQDLRAFLSQTDYMSKLEKFLKLLHREPKNVQINKQANNSKYIPIDHVETTLDRLYFGLWSTYNFRYQVVANEIVGSIELEIIHPLTGLPLRRTGAGSVPIRQNKGSQLTDITQKIKTALVMDFPHLKAQCLKNAAQSLGKAFGRSLNRDFMAEYKPMLPEDTTTEDSIKNATKEAINKAMARKEQHNILNGNDEN